GAIEGRMGFHRLQMELESQFSEIVSQSLMVSTGPSRGTQRIGTLESELQFWDLSARAEWAIFASKAARIDTGLDFFMFGGKGKYTGPAPSNPEGDPGGSTLASENYVVIEETGVTPVRPAAFIEASLRPHPNWLLVPGVRADYVADGDDWTVDP